MRLMTVGLWAVLCLASVPVVTNSKLFVCANEKDHLSLLDPQADAWYRRATALAKPDTPRPWGRIVELCSKAMERGHQKTMHDSADLYCTGRPGGVEKDPQKTLNPYQKVINLDVPQGFYGTRTIIGNCVDVKNPATDSLTFLGRVANLGDPPALTELGKLYIYVAKEKELRLVYASRASSRGYALASYKLGGYYELVEHNYPRALRYYRASVSRGGRSATFFLLCVFGKRTPSLSVVRYTPDEKPEKLYYSLYL